jgi:NADPH:quinone reductase-like Zn-dependent oxidoreductase
VLLQPGVSCGRCAQCLSGRDNRCPRFEVLGYRTHPGGYAEYVKVPLQNVVPIPDEIDFVRAAAFPLTFLTAWHMLMTRARLERGEDVLVLAAGSGVGHAAIQIASIQGARVFTTAGSDEKADRARSLGAHAVVNHRRQDIAAEILRLTDRRGVDVVVEHVGEATWPASMRVLARGGRLVTCGATTGPRVGLDLRAVYAKQLSVFGSYVGTKGELLRVARLFFAGEIAPVVDRTFPLSAAADAQRRLEASEHFGKIVLEV